MQWLTGLIGLMGAVIGVVVTSLVNVRLSRHRMNADIKARWDAALLDNSQEMSAATRTLRHLAEGYGESIDKTLQVTRLDDAHERLRVSSEKIRLVGNRRVQIAARRVQRHAYSVRLEGERGEDPRVADGGGTPVQRLNDALQEFYRAVREQLVARDPEDVIHDSELDRRAAGRAPGESAPE